MSVGGGSQHCRSDHRQEVGGACRSGEGRKFYIFCEKNCQISVERGVIIR